MTLEGVEKLQCMQLYYNSAEAARRLFFLENNASEACTCCHVLQEHVIMDYCTCFSINPEIIDALVEAIVVAVDNGE